MSAQVSWLKHLKKNRGAKIVAQALRMLKYHRTPFDLLLDNIFRVMKPYAASFTFPVVASVAVTNPKLMNKILRNGHEVAIHGFKHVKYPYLTEQEQEADILRALNAFKKAGFPANGFRAPYNAYTAHTIRLIEKYGLLWDAGIGYNPNYRKLIHPFKVSFDDHTSSFTCLPLSRWSDDLMIDIYGYRDQQIAATLKEAIKRGSEARGVVMFDLHPIRIGQPQYVKALEEAVAYGTELNGWFPKVTEAVQYWEKSGAWKGDASFCCLMTGDIDAFVFLDYLRRLL